jgi:hypothetical protein
VTVHCLSWEGIVAVENTFHGRGSFHQQCGNFGAGANDAPTFGMISRHWSLPFRLPNTIQLSILLGNLLSVDRHLPASLAFKQIHFGALSCL